MGKFIDKILDSMKLSDEEYDEEYMFEEEEEEEVPKKTRFSKRDSTDDIDDEPVQQAPKPKSRSTNVVPMRSARGLEVCMVKPTSVDDAREICDTLLSGRAVVINLEGIHVEIAQRIIDFTSGACYSMSGNLQKISNYIFIVTPRTVELSGDFQDMLQLGEGFDISTLSLNL